MELAAPANEAELESALSEIGQIAENVRYIGRYSTIDLAGANNL
jgi:prephenate dehydratase